MAQTLTTSQVNDYSFLLFQVGVPRVCLYMEIKCCKNIIRIYTCFEKHLLAILNSIFRTSNLI